MNIKEIAAKLIEMRETRMTAFIMSGQLREELGFEGYSEALRQRWIQPDEDGSGMITITNNLGKVAEMRAMAEEFKKEDCCPTCKKSECKCKCKDGKCVCNCESALLRESADLAVHHANRTKMTLAEIATMGLGHLPDTASSPISGVGHQGTPQAPQSISKPDPAEPNRPQSLTIGTDVRIVQDGKTYVGKVSQVKPDGKMQISFGGEKPAAERDYDKSEVTPLGSDGATSNAA